MWNFNYAIPSLMILAVIVGHYISLPRLQVRRNLIFIYLIVVESTAMTIDVVSTWADMNHEFFPDWVLYALNTAYFIAFFALAFAFFLFTVNLLKVDLTKRRLLRILVEIPVNIGIILVLIAPWTKWFYYIDDAGYHAGPLYNILYPVFGSYILFSFIFIYRRRGYFIRKRELQVIVGCNTVLAIGLIFRYAFPRLLLMDIFYLSALIILFLGFENPDTYLVERTFIFNRIALREYLSELNGKKHISALVFGIRNYQDMLEIYGILQIYQAVFLIQNYLRKTFPKYQIFNFENGKFIFVSTEKVEWEGTYSTLSKRFEKPWISREMDICLDLCGCVINIDPAENQLPFEVLVHVFNEATQLAEKSIDSELIVFSDESIEQIIDENEIKRALEYAIEHEQVEVYLQPIIESTTGKLVGAEALSRIKSAEGKLISPGQFISIAEQNGKIDVLGRQVFRKVCKYLNMDEIKALNLSYINVNLSPIQFLRQDLDETLYRVVQEAGADVDSIHLEITEDAFIDEKLMEKQIAALMDKGFKFALDDFGKGYSNLSRLRKSPFINIKLDISIVWDYCSAPDQILPNEIKAFVNSGLDVTAEGIEDEDMANKMRDIGCKYLQGFYFSKPLPVDEFIKKYH